MTLRIVYDNAADLSSISASTTAGSLVASNLLTDMKSEVWRSTGTSATLTLTWTSSKQIGMVALPFCNLTSTATFRVKVFTEVADASPALDTAAQQCCRQSSTPLAGWSGVAASVNSYSYGGANYAVLWFTPTIGKKVTIDIVDSSNPAGYIEASRIVVGNYFTPEVDAELNVDWSLDENTQNTRSEGSDLRSDIGTRSQMLKFNLSNMSPADRFTMSSILRGNGKSVPMFVSLFPSDTDASKEQAYQIYGKITGAISINHSNWNLFGCPVEISES